MKNAKNLDALYAEVKRWGGQDGLTHHFDLGGMYAREVRLKAGEIVCMHVHDYDHLSLYVGHIRVMKDAGEQEFNGAGAVMIGKGERHAIRAISDTLWICAHRAVEVADLEAVKVVAHA